MQRTHRESLFWLNWTAIAGRYISDEAKMTGMMPAWFTLSGMYVELPPNILRPTMRRAYWTGIRRCACSMKMTAAMMTRPISHHDAEDPPALALLRPPTWSSGRSRRPG